VRDDPVDANDGGESACFAHLICPECGVVLDGADHRQTCTWVNPQSGIDPMDMVEPSPED
jgi:hypothetical protein